jgi:hypothetical protein
MHFNCPELFLFLRGMMGALAPFSYLISYNNPYLRSNKALLPKIVLGNF